MINDYSKGGLKMLDIASFNQALKMKWVKSYLDDQDTGKWKFFFNKNNKKSGGGGGRGGKTMKMRRRRRENNKNEGEEEEGKQ